MKLWDKVEISWVDSSHAAGWQTTVELERKPHSVLCHTIGYFYRDKGDALMLVMNYADEGTHEEQVNGVMTIPKVAIKRKRVLK